MTVAMEAEAVEGLLNLTKLLTIPPPFAQGKMRASKCELLVERVCLRAHDGTDVTMTICHNLLVRSL